MRVSHENDRIRLRHMLENAIRARRFAEGKSREDLDTDELLLFGLDKAVQIVCEAAYKVTPEFRAENPQIPWGEMIGMRHIVVHVYYELDVDVIWETVTDDLPPLISQIQEILGIEDE